MIGVYAISFDILKLIFTSITNYFLVSYFLQFYQIIHDFFLTFFNFVLMKKLFFRFKIFSWFCSNLFLCYHLSGNTQTTFKLTLVI